MSGRLPVETRTRLPFPAGIAEIDAGKWRVLVETIFPSAKTTEAIVLALDYCKVRGLDVFRRPVHIVPMWNSALQKEVETVWPGINEIQTTAARTKQWAGMDEPKWGPDVTHIFKGWRWEDKKKVLATMTMTIPEWCAVTVYRMIEGQRCPFTEPVYWLEAYSRAGGRGSELPTDMWVKRPHGQIHKVAKASSLRAAFPEEGDYTAEEMEGKEIDAGGIVIEHEPASPQAATPAPRPAQAAAPLPNGSAAPPDHPRRAEAIAAYKKLITALEPIKNTPHASAFLQAHAKKVFPDLDLIAEVSHDTHAALARRFADLGIDLAAERARMAQEERMMGADETGAALQ